MLAFSNIVTSNNSIYLTSRQSGLQDVMFNALEQIMLFCCLQTVALANPMLTALLDDKAEFVELFLQNGLSMREFLSPQILCQLYAGVSHPPPKQTTTRKFNDIWC